MRSAFDVVALAASAGGLNALTHVLAALPRDFPAALVVVQHLDPRHRSVMADILARRTALRVKEAKNAEFAGMPEAAQATGRADFVLALDEIAPVLQKLCSAADD